MNLDELLRLSAGADDVAGFDLEGGRERLREGFRRLRDDLAEARRVDDMAELADIDDEDSRFGYQALERHDLPAAERYLRRAAQHGNDEAAYWLALVLRLRASQLRLMRRNREADDVAAEATRWQVRTQDSGVAQALDSYPGDAFPGPLPDDAWQGGSLLTGSGRARGAARSAARIPAPAASDEPRYAVGMELQPYWLGAVLTDESGQVVGEGQYDLAGMEPVTVVRAAAAAAEEMLSSTVGSGFPRDRVVLGLQLGGPVDAETGTVHFLSKFPPSSRKNSEFKWENVLLGPRLRQETGLETVVLNDAVAFAELEQWFGVGRVTEDFAVMMIREGVGGSVVSGGVPFKGPVEIGNFIIYSGGVRRNDAGQYGALESAGGISGIVATASELASRAIDNIEAAADIADEDGPGRAALGAFTAAGVAVASGIGCMIGFAGPSHLVLYAPDVMLRRGRRAADAFLDEAEKFRNFVAFKAYQDCELVLRPLGPYQGALGAALAALHRCFEIEPTPALADAPANEMLTITKFPSQGPAAIR